MAKEELTMTPMMIVAATDFSDSARAGVERAALIAWEHQAQLTLVHAFDEASWERFLSLDTAREKHFADPPIPQAWEKIRAAAGQLARKHDVVVSGVVAVEHAPEAIAATAKTVHASLIVLGPHGDRLSDLLYLGSTALGIARIAACPVLVVRNRPKAGYARCLVGIDFSPPSLRAATTAARLFPAAAITLLHAAQSIEGPMIFTGASTETIDAANAELRALARKRLVGLFPAGQPGRLDSAARRAVTAPVHLALQRALKSGKFNVVALGRDSKAALAERVLGSVPASMLVNAPADLLIVP